MQIGVITLPSRVTSVWSRIEKDSWYFIHIFFNILVDFNTTSYQLPTPMVLTQNILFNDCFLNRFQLKDVDSEPWIWCLNWVSELWIKSWRYQLFGSILTVTESRTSSNILHISRTLLVVTTPSTPTASLDRRSSVILYHHICLLFLESADEVSKNWPKIYYFAVLWIFSWQNLAPYYLITRP